MTFEHLYIHLNDSFKYIITMMNKFTQSGFRNVYEKVYLLVQK